MQRLLLFILLSLIVVGCGPRYVDYFPYDDDGRAKPQVFLVPVIDHSNANSPNLANELTSDLRYQFMHHGDLYLFSPSEVQADLTKCSNLNFFGTDISCAKQLRHGDFLLILELGEHRVVPYTKDISPPIYDSHRKNSRWVLMMKMRIRVIDLRYSCPQLVLQEVFVSNHRVPCERTDKAQFEEGQDPASQYAYAHQQMIDRLACRLEEIIWSVR